MKAKGMIEVLKVREFFGFSKLQLKFLMALSTIFLILALFLLIRTFSTPAEEMLSFPVILGDEQVEYVGVFVLDPNTAPADSLELLPGIGLVLADRIILYRKKHRFQSEVDITSVKGIGPKLFEKLRPYLKVGRT